MMVSAVGGISVLDSLAALAGIKAARAAPPRDVAPAGRIDRRQHPDVVKISPEAQQAGETMRFDQLTDQEKRQVRELRRRDGEVRRHEQAHEAAAGPHAGGASYAYTVGPDGRRYAVGGEVPIDLSPVEGDPQATIRKMQQIMQAALAPSDPSTADRQVAAQARQVEREAQTELRRDERGGPSRHGVDLYA